jgi:hypothetical protein
MPYHQVRILCALRDKIAENDKSLNGHLSIGGADRERSRGRLHPLREDESLAIWQTCLTSGETILTWTAAGMVAVD